MALFKNKNFVFTFFGILYALGAGYCFKKYGNFHYAYLSLPFILLAIYYALFDIIKIFYLILFLTPLAVTIRSLGLSDSINLSLPTEPLLFGMMCIFLMNLAYVKIVDTAFNKNIVTTIVYIHLAWILFTSFTSSMPIVSIKFFISKLWFIIPFYFFASYFIKTEKNVISVITAYILPLCIICIYTIAKHASVNFQDEKADLVMQPFYNDHTAYGAAIAMFIFPALFSLFLKGLSNKLKIVYFIAFLILATALFLSFARASWIGVVGSLLVYGTLQLKIKFRYLFTSFMILLTIFLIFNEQIFIVLNRNDQDSKKGVANHVESITNVKTDASNVERINRWKCAMRMFNERPIFGWGPGTYQFQYAPFQKFSERTIISTNEGDGGNCHSEYLGPLAEQGVFGCLIMLVLLFVTLGTGYSTYYGLESYNDKLIFASIFLGLITYFIHGFLNNFLDTDKLAVPFWSFMCILVYYNLKSKKLTETANS
jgi:putative inorganic carbon (hco3(-)) transporter